jgi:carbonic anhydrase
MELLHPTHDFVVKAYHDASREEQIEHCCQHALRNSLQHLHTFPWISDKVTTGQLELHAWYFELASGLIHALDQKTNQFQELLSVYALKK